MDGIQGQKSFNASEKTQAIEKKSDAQTKNLENNVEIVENSAQPYSKDEKFGFNEAQDAAVLMSESANDVAANEAFFIPSLSEIFEKIGDLISLDADDTKDGQIDDTLQGIIGDCWLLSSVNSLSYCKKGKEIIENTLEYKDNGDTNVHFKGFSGTINISAQELRQAKLSDDYSYGDDDMVILELAVQEVFDEISALNYAIDPNSADSLTSALNQTMETEKNGLQLFSGSSATMLYLLTGKKPKVDISSKDELKKVLDKFEKTGGKDMATTANFIGETYVKDINGTKVQLSSVNHTLSIKEVKNGIITLVNPWDSAETIQISQSEFLAAKPKVNSVDMSDSSKNVNIINGNYKLDKDGNKVFSFDRTGEKMKNDDKEEVSVKKEDITYDKATGKIIKRELYGEDNKLLNAKEYDPKTGKIITSDKKEDDKYKDVKL